MLPQRICINMQAEGYVHSVKAKCFPQGSVRKSTSGRLWALREDPGSTCTPRRPGVYVNSAKTRGLCALREPQVLSQESASKIQAEGHVHSAKANCFPPGTVSRIQASGDAHSVKAKCFPQGSVRKNKRRVTCTP